MWKSFSDSENLYLLRLDTNNDGFLLLLTDFSCVWEGQITSESLVRCFKECNPIIEATEDIVKSNLLEVIDNLEKVDISVKSCENDRLELIFKRRCGDFTEYLKSQSIVYKFSLIKQDQNEFKNKVTVASIQTVYYLERQQKMLLNLIQKKDRELEEYRMEKGDISRSDLKTDKFEPNVLSQSYDKMFLKVFTENEDFWKKFTGKHGDIEISTISVDTEPWNARKRKKMVHNSKNVFKKGGGIVYKKN